MNAENVKKTVIKNAQLVLESGILWDGALLLQGERIIKYGKQRDMEEEIASAEIRIDAKGAYVGPGLVDIHSHAGSSTLFQEDPVTAANGHLAKGTTSVLATLGYRSSVEE